MLTGIPVTGPFLRLAVTVPLNCFVLLFGEDIFDRSKLVIVWECNAEPFTITILIDASNTGVNDRLPWLAVEFDIAFNKFDFQCPERIHSGLPVLSSWTLEIVPNLYLPASEG